MVPEPMSAYDSRLQGMIIRGKETSLKLTRACNYMNDAQGDCVYILGFADQSIILSETDAKRLFAGLLTLKMSDTIEVRLASNDLGDCIDRLLVGGK